MEISLEEMTYLDTIFTALREAHIDGRIIKNLADYLSTEMFDTEGMDIDLHIDEIE